jgi:hypothetical protein
MNGVVRRLKAKYGVVLAAERLFNYYFKIMLI